MKSSSKPKRIQSDALGVEQWAQDADHRAA